MIFTASTPGFDLFIELYMFGSIALVLFLFVANLYSSLLILIDEAQTPSNNDFYQQVKELLNPDDVSHETHLETFHNFA